MVGISLFVTLSIKCENKNVNVAHARNGIIFALQHHGKGIIYVSIPFSYYLKLNSQFFLSIKCIFVYFTRALVGKNVCIEYTHTYISAIGINFMCTTI